MQQCHHPEAFSHPHQNKLACVCVCKCVCGTPEQVKLFRCCPVTWLAAADCHHHTELVEFSCINLGAKWAYGWHQDGDYVGGTGGVKGCGEIKLCPTLSSDAAHTQLSLQRGYWEIFALQLLLLEFFRHHTLTKFSYSYRFSYQMRWCSILFISWADDFSYLSWHFYNFLKEKSCQCQILIQSKQTNWIFVSENGTLRLLTNSTGKNCTVWFKVD